MPHRDVILEQTLQCLLPHCHPKWGDRTPLDVFNRLLAKNIRPAGWTCNTHLDNQEHQITSRQEQWSTEALGRLSRAHREADRDSDSPVVLVEYAGALRLLDGNHRINHWVATADGRTHPINIHRVAGTGRFIELPAASHGA
jgi:hypothetical protein